MRHLISTSSVRHRREAKGPGRWPGPGATVSKKAQKNKDLAEKFISYVIDPETNYELCTELGGFLSPIKEVEGLLGADDVIDAAPRARMSETTIISGVPSTEYTDWNAVKLLVRQRFLIRS